MWCGQVVRIARQVLALPLVNIGGIDIINGQHKLLLAILWQLMRYNIRGLLQVCPSCLIALHCPGLCHESVDSESSGHITCAEPVKQAIALML